MGQSWQQGPLSPGAIGRFPVPESLPGRLLYAEPLHRYMRMRFGRISDSVSFEPDVASVELDRNQLRPQPGQSVIAHDPERYFAVTQMLSPASGRA